MPLEPRVDLLEQARARRQGGQRTSISREARFTASTSGFSRRASAMASTARATSTWSPRLAKGAAVSSVPVRSSAIMASMEDNPRIVVIFIAYLTIEMSTEFINI
jgi:hypothetical protein